MLGIIFTNGLSVAPHVQHLMISNAQTLYALKILQAHGLCEKSIQAVFRCVIPARFCVLHLHGAALLEPKTDKTFMDFCAKVPGLASAPTTCSAMTTCVSNQTKVCLDFLYNSDRVYAHTA